MVPYASAVIAGVGITLYELPPLDVAALLGALGGALVFVFNARRLPLLQRVVYWLVSWGMGYLATPDVIRLLPFAAHSLLVAFVSSLLLVTLGEGLIRTAKTAGLRGLVARLRGRSGAVMNKPE